MNDPGKQWGKEGSIVLRTHGVPALRCACQRGATGNEWHWYALGKIYSRKRLAKGKSVLTLAWLIASKGGEFPQGLMWQRMRQDHGRAGGKLKPLPVQGGPQTPQRVRQERAFWFLPFTLPLGELSVQLGEGKCSVTPVRLRSQIPREKYLTLPAASALES